MSLLCLALNNTDLDGCRSVSYKWDGLGWVGSLGGVRHKAAFMLQISFQRKKVMPGLWLVTVGQHGCLLEGMCTGQAKDISLLFSEKLVLDLWQSAKVKHQGVGQLEDAKLRIWACCVTGHSSPSNMWSTYLVSIGVCTKSYNLTQNLLIFS